MKKKCLIMGLLISAFLIGCGEKDSNTIQGRFIQTETTNCLVSDTYGFIDLSNESGNEDIFKEIGNGDEIKITIDSICETYPVWTNVYSLEFIEDGNIDDIDYAVLEEMVSTGRIPVLYNYQLNEDGTYTAENGVTYKEFKRVTGRANNAAKDSYFDILTNKEDITFSDISNSILSSNTEDLLDEEETIILWMG